MEPVSRESVSYYGIVKPEGDETRDVFLIEDLVEKPSPDAAPSNLAIAGRYIFSEEIYAALKKTPPDKNGEIQLTDAIRILLQEGKKIAGVWLKPEERRYDIGNFHSYFEAFIEFALADPQIGSSLRDKLSELLLNGSHK